MFLEDKHYFISDIHLGLQDSTIEKQKELSLVRFLDNIGGNAKKLYIVGDLFDCWIEYRKVVPKGYFRLLAKLNELIESGVHIHFLSGNHDFWLNTYLRDEVGLDINYNELTDEINGKKFYMIHGDGLSKKDLGYRILKKILRSPINQFLYSWIHPDIGIYIAERSSKTSRIYNVENETQSPVYMKDFAVQKLTEGFDYIIMGHYHKPVMEKININNHKGYFITLGDWIKYNSYGLFNGTNFTLNFWEKNNN